MYLPVIEPIDRLCTEAIERARSGDISTARELIDRVRTMRSRLSRSVHNHRFESIENWINNAGLDDEDVMRYREQASALSKKYVETIVTHTETIRRMTKTRSMNP